MEEFPVSSPFPETLDMSPSQLAAYKKTGIDL